MASRGVHLAPYAGVIAIGLHFLTWWQFIDGRYLLQNVDLRKLLQELDGDRAFDVIDSILVDELLSGVDVEGGIEKVRTNILSVYNGNRIRGSSNDNAGGMIPREQQPIAWTEQTEDGFAGLEAPLG